ncbi:MAG: hypothetical protein QW745_08355 [Thermoplasmata archaeon]
MPEKQIKEGKENEYKIKKFYMEPYDTNNIFNILQSVGEETAIKIKKNAAPENIRGSKKRRKKVRKYKRLGYRKWAGYKKYGIRWVGTEGIFSAVKRKYGEIQFYDQKRSDCRRIPEILGIRYNKMLC